MYREKLIFLHSTDLQSDDVKTIWIEMRHSMPYLVCNACRQPNQWFLVLKSREVKLLRQVMN